MYLLIGFLNVFVILVIITFVFQTLPIFLDALVTAWGAILISVTLILLFGEVSSRCTSLLPEYFACDVLVVALSQILCNCV